ncbi:MAG: J domain-containing protein, partial [Victivallaceae bacterium]
ELEKKNLAEMRRAMKNMAESQGDEYLDDEEDWEDWDNFYDWDDFCGGGFGDVGNKSLRELFGGNGEKLHGESGERSLKKLYRELCLRYHPDRFGTHDAKTKRLWIEIQEAYQDGDINQLRTIHAGIEIESGKSELNCSEIDDLICDLELSIKEKRDQIRNCKSAPFWGFAGWQEIKRRKISKEIKFEYERSHQQNEKKLRQLESELERLLNSYKPKSKPSKKVIQKQEVNKQTPDLFGDLFAEI